MKPAIIDITGIGPAAAEALAEHRIRTVASLANASVENISAIPGFSEARAERVIAAAAELLAVSATDQPAEAAEADDQVKASGKGKKDKKDKKDKRKGKGKKGKKGKNKKDKKGKGKKKGKK